MSKEIAELPTRVSGGKNRRCEQVRLLDLEVADICEVKVVIEGDEAEWVERTVISRTPESVTFKCPGGWEEGREYELPATDERVLRVWRPEDRPRELAEKVLGNAVHPEALRRLFEIWPEAYVEVKRDPHDYRERYDGRFLGRSTTATIYAFDPQSDAGTPATVRTKVTCHYRDHFVKAQGIRKAFNGALRELVVIQKQAGQI